MKRIAFNLSMLSGALLVFGLMILACGGTHRAIISAGPLLVINDRSFDAGEVQGKTDVEHTFQVQNQGSQALEITNVKTT